MVLTPPSHPKRARVNLLAIVSRTLIAMRGPSMGNLLGAHFVGAIECQNQYFTDLQDCKKVTDANYALGTCDVKS